MICQQQRTIDGNPNSNETRSDVYRAEVESLARGVMEVSYLVDFPDLGTY